MTGIEPWLTAGDVWLWGRYGKDAFSWLVKHLTKSYGWPFRTEYPILKAIPLKLPSVFITQPAFGHVHERSHGCRSAGSSRAGLQISFRFAQCGSLLMFRLTGTRYWMPRQQA